MKLKASYKCSLIIIATSLLSACQNLSGSFQQRSQQLSHAIQRAYTVHPETANRLAPLIIQNSEKHQLSPLTFAALIQQESSYRSHVTSTAGAIGLTQIIPRYWQQSCPGDLYNEVINLACGSYVLAHYEQKSGNIKTALAYYNVGPTGYNTHPKMKQQGDKYARQVKEKEQLLKKSL